MSRKSPARTSSKAPAVALLEVRAPSPADLDPTIDLVSKTFGFRGYWAFDELCRAGYFVDSPYDLAASRVGFVDGQMVTHFGVWDYQTRVESARLRTGGIGCVATHAKYRKRGYMDQTTTASIAAMRQRGYDLSILFGLADFYDQFGYCRAWTDTSMVIDNHRLPVKPGPRVKVTDRPCEHSPRLTELFNRQFDTTTGMAVRPFFRSIRYGGWNDRYLRTWGPSASKIDGYAIYEIAHGKLLVQEVVGDADTALAVVGELAGQKDQKQIDFRNLPHTQPLAGKLRGLTVRMSEDRQRAGGPMVRVINLRPCLTKLEKVMSQRLACSTLAGWTGPVLVEHGGEKLTLQVGKSGIKVADAVASKHRIRAGAEMAQFILGTDDAAEVAQRGKTVFTGDAAGVAGAIFPQQHPIFSQIDFY